MYRWFHPNLGNADAERLLKQHGQDGSFLVRHSATHTGYLSLSVRRGDEITHMRIPQTGDFFDLQGGEQFSSIAELVQHYTENPVKGRNGEVFELKIPLNCPDPTERWFHGSIKSEAADKLIREKGVNGSFLVRRSQRSLGDYVLTIRSKDVNSQADVVDHVIIRHQNNKYILCTGGGIKFDSLTELVEHYRRLSIVESEGAVYNMKYPFNTTSITALDIDDRVNELSKENPNINGKDGFCEEFEHIHQQECKVLFDRKIGQEDRNILKNRYRNILPYDYTRVILKKPISSRNVNKNQHHHHQYTSSQQQQQHQQQQQQRQQHLLNESNNNANNATTTINSSDSDYINANYIKLVNDGTIISPRTEPVSNSKIYIATQGPLPNTVHDFWLMVWQEKSDCIVMVTKEVERGKNKCYRYWPTIEQQIQQSGPIEVKILSETTRKVDGSNGGGGDDDEDYTIREFELRYLNIGGDQNSTIDHRAVRRVVQYQYYAWQDQNTPSDPVSILSFLKDINRRPIHGPLIVHCSAGIGRTGALIVIDMLIDQLKYHGLFYEFDIQRVVEVARAQRSGLVQTVTQYKFIYLAVQRYIASLKH